MSDKIFMSKENPKNTIQFSEYKSVWIAEKTIETTLLNWLSVKQKTISIGLSNQCHINKKCRKKFFEFRKIKKTQFSFLTPYPSELQNKSLNNSIELVSIKKLNLLIYPISII